MASSNVLFCGGFGVRGTIEFFEEASLIFLMFSPLLDSMFLFGLRPKHLFVIILLALFCLIEGLSFRSLLNFHFFGLSMHSFIFFLLI